jgi:hypothetical protein
VACGSNERGQLGVHGAPAAHPVVVKGMPETDPVRHSHSAPPPPGNSPCEHRAPWIQVRVIACGDFFSVACTARGKLWAWGDGSASRLCSAAAASPVTLPQLLPFGLSGRCSMVSRRGGVEPSGEGECLADARQGRTCGLGLLQRTSPSWSAVALPPWSWRRRLQKRRQLIMWISPRLSSPSSPAAAGSGWSRCQVARRKLLW